MEMTARLDPSLPPTSAEEADLLRQSKKKVKRRHARGPMDDEDVDEKSPPTWTWEALLHSHSSGCCKPPTNGGKNAAGPDTDCETWSTNEDKLCYDCESCIARVLKNMRTEWRSLAIINDCILFLVIIIYSSGCCAVRSNRSSRYHGYKGYR